LKSASLAISFCIALGLSALWSVPRTLAHPQAPAPSKSLAQRTATNVKIKSFDLTDQNGKPFKFSDIAGKVVVVGFGYTTCPDICPLITGAMRTVQTGLSAAERGTVYFLTMTTDPEIDSPQVLARYAKRYSADLSHWSFLTGDLATLQPVWKNFGVKVDRKARGLIDHTALTALIDGSGTMKFAYHGTAPQPNVILQDLRSLLAKERR
jgi:protein SCO1/2